MLKRVLVVSLFSLLLLGCSNKSTSSAPTYTLEKSKSSVKSFETYWGEKKLTLPLIKSYQHLTNKQDQEFYNILNLLEQAPNATNIAFLISNADYIGAISGERKYIEESYIVVRVQNNLADKRVSKGDFQNLLYFYKKNYERIMSSNYMNETINSNLKKVNSDGKSKFKKDLGLKSVQLTPIKFKKIDDKSLMTINLLTLQGEEGQKEILTISSLLLYDDNLLYIIVNSPIKNKLTEKFIAEKEKFTKEYLDCIAPKK